MYLFLCKMYTIALSFFPAMEIWKEITCTIFWTYTAKGSSNVPDMLVQQTECLEESNINEFLSYLSYLSYVRQISYRIIMSPGLIFDRWDAGRGEEEKCTRGGAGRFASSWFARLN